MVNCLSCGKEFQAWNYSQAMAGKAKYCSKACRDAGYLSRYERAESTLAERVEANAAINNAIATGSLVRPGNCEDCGCACRPDAHHESYARDKWFDVKWLCRSCHMQRHAKPVDPVAPRKPNGRFRSHSRTEVLSGLDYLAGNGSRIGGGR